MKSKEILQKWSEQQVGLLHIHLGILGKPNNPEDLYDELLDIITAPEVEDKELI